MQPGGQPSGSAGPSGSADHVDSCGMPEKPLTASGLWHRDRAFTTQQMLEIAKGATGPNARAPSAYMHEKVARHRAEPPAALQAYERKAAEEAAEYEARLNSYQQGTSLPPRQQRPQGAEAGAGPSDGVGAAAGTAGGGRGPAAACHIS